MARAPAEGGTSSARRVGLADHEGALDVLAGHEPQRRPQIEEAVGLGVQARHRLHVVGERSQAVEGGPVGDPDSLAGLPARCRVIERPAAKSSVSAATSTR